MKSLSVAVLAVLIGSSAHADISCQQKSNDAVVVVHADGKTRTTVESTLPGFQAQGFKACLEVAGMSCIEAGTVGMAANTSYKLGSNGRLYFSKNDCESAQVNLAIKQINSAAAGLKHKKNSSIAEIEAYRQSGESEKNRALTRKRGWEY